MWGNAPSEVPNLDNLRPGDIIFEYMSKEAYLKKSNYDWPSYEEYKKHMKPKPTQNTDTEGSGNTIHARPKASNEKKPKKKSIVEKSDEKKSDEKKKRKKRNKSNVITINDKSQVKI